MADNVFDKLDEQSKILARIDKNTANESSTVEEMIRTNDPRMIEFVKTADRVFIYSGDKSELNRKNKKCRISSPNLSNISESMLGSNNSVTLQSSPPNIENTCFLYSSVLNFSYSGCGSRSVSSTFTSSILSRRYVTISACPLEKHSK